MIIARFVKQEIIMGTEVSKRNLLTAPLVNLPMFN